MDSCEGNDRSSPAILIDAKRLFGDAETGVSVGTKTILNVGGNSKVDIERKDK